MILDAVGNLKKYATLNSRFLDVFEFLKANDLESLPLGKYAVRSDEVYLNVVYQSAKDRAASRIETHNRMIDIQIAISGPEEHGYIPRECLSATYYDADKDISFYADSAKTYFTVHPGTMVIYFPEDGHAPGITSTGLRKAIFKVKVQA